MFQGQVLQLQWAASKQKLLKLCPWILSGICFTSLSHSCCSLLLTTTLQHGAGWTSSFKNLVNLSWIKLSELLPSNKICICVPLMNLVNWIVPLAEVLLRAWSNNWWSWFLKGLESSSCYCCTKASLVLSNSSSIWIK